MANEKTVEIRLRVAAPGADVIFAALSKGGADVAKSLRGVSVAAGEGGHEFAKMAGAVAAGEAIFEAIKRAAEAAGEVLREVLVELPREAIKEAAAEQLQLQQVATILRAQGSLTAEYAAHLEKLTEVTRLHSTATDGQARAAEIVLLRFHATRSEIDTLLPQIANLAAVTGEDLASAAEKVGRALDLGMTRGLKAVGINLSENIDATKRADAIAKAIAGTYGGAAANATKTYSGALTQLHSTWEELLETFGHAVTDNHVVLAAIALLNDALNAQVSVSGNAADALSDYASHGLLSIVDGAARATSALGPIAAGILQLAATALRAIASIRENIQTLPQLGHVLKDAALGATTGGTLGGPVGVIPGALIGAAIGNATAPDSSVAAAAAAQKQVESLNAAAKALDEQAAQIPATFDLAASHIHAFGDELGHGAKAYDAYNANVAEHLARLEELSPKSEEYKSEVASLRTEIDQATAGHLALNHANAEGAVEYGVLADSAGASAEGHHKAGKAAEEAAKKIAEAQKAMAQEIEQTKAEIAVRQQAIEQGLTVEQTEVRVAAAKEFVKTGSESLRAAYIAEHDALIPLNLEKEKQITLQNLEAKLGTDTAAKALELTAIREVVAARGTELDIEKAIAVAKAAQTAIEAHASPERVAQVRAEAAAAIDLTHAVGAEHDAFTTLRQTQDSIQDTQARIDVLKAQASGTLSLAQATEELAVIEAKRQAANRGGTLSPEGEAGVRQLAKLQVEFEKTQRAAARFARTTDDTLNEAFDSVLSAGQNALENLFASGEFDAKHFADSLKSIIFKALADIATRQIVLPILANVVGLIGGGGGVTDATGGATGVASQGAGLLQQGQQLLSLGSTLKNGFGLLSGALGESTAATVDLTGVVASDAASVAASGVSIVGEGSIGTLATETGSTISLGSSGAVAPGAAGAGIGGAAATGAILFAVVAALETIGAAFAASKARDTFYNNHDAATFAGKQFDPITGGIGNILTYALTGQKAATLFEAQQRSLYGGASVKDLVYTTILNILNPLNFALGIASKLPTQGTVLRKGFEELLEPQKGKGGFGIFASNSGTFKRGIGQSGLGADNVNGGDYSREERAVIGGGARGIATELGVDFVDAQNRFNDKLERFTNVTTKQDNIITALAVLYRTEVGATASASPTRVPGLKADFLGSGVALGADGAQLADTAGQAIAAIGTPERLLDKLKEFYASAGNDLTLQNVTDTIKGMAEALGGDVPQGVDKAAIALRKLQEEGLDKLTFKDIQTQINGAVTEATALGSAAHDAFISGLFKQDVDTAQLSKQLFDQINEAFKKQIAESAFNTLIQDKFQGNILGPLLAKFDDIQAQVESGDLSVKEATTARQAALREARASLEEMRPLFDELVQSGRDLAGVFNDADVSVLGLATSIVKLQEAQDSFNTALDARIFALRNQGQADPAQIRKPLADIDKEFQLTQLKAFGSISEIIAAANSGVITQTELPGYLKTARGSGNELSTEDKLGALTKLQDLAEQDLAIRIAAINAETAATVKLHTDNITRLQKERDQIQRNSKAAVDAKQTELDAVQESLKTAQAWQQTLEGVKATILSIETGNTSPDSQIVRLQTLQSEFDAQRARFNDKGLTDEQRQAAAAKLNDLAPRILEQAQSAGLAQSSEAFRVIYEQVLAALDGVKGEAGAGAVNTDDLIKQQTQLQADIKALEKAGNAALDAIDKQIQTEKDAITAAQDAGTAKIQEVSNNTAGVLEWIKGQGNAIFEQKQTELKDKLAALGVTDISIESIQASSLEELQKIRAVIEGQGSVVTDGKPSTDTTGGGSGSGSDGAASSGRYGITASGQDQLKGTVSGLTAQGGTFASLGTILGLSQQQIDAVKAGGGPIADLIATIQGLFPGAKSATALHNIVEELRHKITDHSYVSPTLGFATGGLVRGSTVARVGESGPELILPLSAALRSYDVRRFFHEVAGPRDTLPRQIQSQPSAPQGPVKIEVSINIYGLDTTNPQEVKAAIKPVIAEAMDEALKRSQGLRKVVADISVAANKLAA